MRHHIIIAMGTNVGIESLKRGQQLLLSYFPDIHFTEIMPTAPLGSKFRGTHFYNALAACTTTHNPERIISILKNMEKRNGDSNELRDGGKVVLDIDLLKYDDKKFHEKDWDREYIKILATCL